MTTVVMQEKNLVFLLYSTAGFVCMMCWTKPALGQFSNALKIIALSFHYFEKILSASGSFAPRPPPGLCPLTLLETSVLQSSDPLIAHTQKKSSGAQDDYNDDTRQLSVNDSGQVVRINVLTTEQCNLVLAYRCKCHFVAGNVTADPEKSNNDLVSHIFISRLTSVPTLVSHALDYGTTSIQDITQVTITPTHKQRRQRGEGEGEPPRVTPSRGDTRIKLFFCG